MSASPALPCLATSDPISQRFERGGVAIALNVLLAFSYILKAVLAMAVLNGYVQRIALPNFDRYRWPKVHFKADFFGLFQRLKLTLYI